MKITVCFLHVHDAFLFDVICFFNVHTCIDVTRGGLMDKTLGLSAGRSVVRIPGRGKCSLRTRARTFGRGTVRRKKMLVSVRSNNVRLD